jgi:hypothetical protein
MARKTSDGDGEREAIYFCGSIRAGREDQPVYAALVGHLERVYGRVLTAHVADAALRADHQRTEQEIYERDMAWLRSATCVVAEVSTPSLGVGYELGVACMLGLARRTLCLYRTPTTATAVATRPQLSAMIRGNPDFTVVEYDTLDQAIAAIDAFFVRL